MDPTQFRTLEIENGAFVAHTERMQTVANEDNDLNDIWLDLLDLDTTGTGGALNLTKDQVKVVFNMVLLRMAHLSGVLPKSR